MLRFGLGLALWLALLVGGWLLVGCSLHAPAPHAEPTGAKKTPEH